MKTIQINKSRPACEGRTAFIVAIALVRSPSNQIFRCAYELFNQPETQIRVSPEALTLRLPVFVELYHQLKLIMGLTFVVQLQIALFLVFFVLILCVIKLLAQSATLSRYRESIKLFKESTDGYQEAVGDYKEAIEGYQRSVDGYQEAISAYQQAVQFFSHSVDEYEFLLKKYGIDEPKSPGRLRAHLLLLLEGDVIAIKELLKQQRQQHPGKPNSWYLEKVIYDLERDQH